MINDKKIEYSSNKSTLNDIFNHLSLCEDLFVPPLSKSLNIKDYSLKIFNKAYRVEAWYDGQLIGLVALYCNDFISKKSFISNVSVLKEFGRKGIAKQLLKKTITISNELGFKLIELEVNKNNINAINLYEKLNFITSKASEKLKMYLNLKEVNTMDNRDYNKEIKDTKDHKYAYNFDFDVMHPYMLRSFIPFFKEGNLLELGSFKGDFTKRFLPHFEDITCVEASDEAIAVAKNELGDRVRLFNALFEEVSLPSKYDNVVLTHVLEHLDDPVAVLKRINDEWLTDTGRFFLVCPNANAPSRQIAVKMGLISHNSAVTPAEKEHGHNITYTLDTLERDARAAGLKVVHRSGIFFKALANFQWDKLLQTDIISKEYLDGCYELGQQYPDLCSSIFIMCEKGDS